MYARYKIQFYSFFIFFTICLVSSFNVKQISIESDIEEYKQTSENQLASKKRITSKVSDFNQPRNAHNSHNSSRSKNTQNKFKNNIQNQSAHKTQYTRTISNKSENNDAQPKTNLTEKHIDHEVKKYNKFKINNISQDNQKSQINQENIKNNNNKDAENSKNTKKFTTLPENQENLEITSKRNAKIEIIENKNKNNESQNIRISDRKNNTMSAIEKSEYPKKQTFKLSLEKAFKKSEYKKIEHRYIEISNIKSIKNLEWCISTFFHSNKKIALPKDLLKNVSENEIVVKSCNCCKQMVIFINNSRTYFEIQKSSNTSNFTFTKKQMKVQDFSQSYDINGTFTQTCKKIGIQDNVANGIKNALEGIHKISDINKKNIKGKIHITNRIIYNDLSNHQHGNNIVAIKFEYNGKVYQFFGFKNSISHGTFYDKNGNCIIWKGLVNPMKSYVVTSKYGNRLHPVYRVMKFHGGIDLFSSTDSNIYSMCTGKVIKKGIMRGFGNCIFVKDNTSGKVFVYAHLASLSDTIKIDQDIIIGEIIGKMGKTGTATAVHLHLEIRKSTQLTEDPINTLNKINHKLLSEEMVEFNTYAKN
jgi:murein DD-endopeptidase MepM/ murein hydrolase activator NlpD